MSRKHKTTRKWADWVQYQAMSAPEVAEALGITVAQVASATKSAFKKLRENESMIRLNNENKELQKRSNDLGILFSDEYNN